MIPGSPPPMLPSMEPGFSGGLIGADSPAAACATGFAGAGAAADPGAFFITDPDTPRGGTPRPAPAQLPAQQYQPGSPPGRHGSARGFSLQPATTRDLLQELECNEDLFLPAAPAGASQDPTPGLLPPGGAATAAAAAPAPAGLTPHPATPPNAQGGLRWPEGVPLPSIELPQSAAPLGAAALPGVPLSRQAGAPPPAPSPPFSLFVPVPAGAPASGPAAAPPAAPGHSASSASLSENSSGAAQGSVGAADNVPRIASLPNLHLRLFVTPPDAGHGQSRLGPQGSGGGKTKPLTRPQSYGNLEASSAAAPAPSEGQGQDIPAPSRYTVPHLPYLTPPHLRKGKGGRQAAPDPRLDPRIDPKKARRIMANRLSAAKSKLKKKGKNQVDVDVQREEGLRLQRDELAADLVDAAAACAREEAEQAELRRLVEEAERQVAAQRMQALQAQPAAAPAAPRYVPGVGWYL